MYLAPPETITNTVVRVRYSDSALACSLSEYNDAFRDLMRKNGLRWSVSSRAYARALAPETSGKPADRAAEITAKLIAAGFAVETDDLVAEKVRDAAWEPEHLRWVLANNNQFHLRWRGKDENLYTWAKTLPNAAYDPDSKAVAVPALYFEEVVGFATEHDFNFTTRAYDLLDHARRDYRRTLLPEVKLPEPKAPKKRTIQRKCDPRRFLDLPARNFVTKTELFPYQSRGVEQLLPLRVGGLAALFRDRAYSKAWE